MFVEDMDFASYPIKASKDSEGNPFLGLDNKPCPRPASPTWRIDYTDSEGKARWEFYKDELSGSVAEIPPRMISIIEKRMKNPIKITRVSMGLFYFQEEPGGEWKKFKPQDKDPRAELFFEGNYTSMYIDEWRKKAYEGEFDPYKLTKAYSKEEAQRKELESLRQQNKFMQDRLQVERQNVDALKKAHDAAIKATQAKIPTQQV